MEIKKFLTFISYFCIKFKFYNKIYLKILAGLVEIYLDGEFKTSCSDIASNKEISTAGDFVLGQSKLDELNLEKLRGDDQTYDQMYEKKKLADIVVENKRTRNFDSHFSFIGRIFNFNIWDQAKKVNSILNIYLDCKLTECGNATQWSDFRQGTHGDVKLKWPTSLLWKSLSIFNTYISIIIS